MLASAGQPSPHGYDAFMVYWVQRALRRICRQKIVRPLFLLLGFSVSSEFQVSVLGFKYDVHCS